MALTAPTNKLEGNTIATTYDQLLFLDNADGMSENSLKVVSTNVGKSALQIDDEKILVQGVDTNNATLFNVKNVAGNSLLKIDASTPAIVINEDSQNMDFRIEGNGNTHLFQLDAGTDRIGIGSTDSPTALLTVGAITTLLTDGTTAVTPEGLNLHITEASKYAMGIKNADASGDGLLIQAGDASDDYALRVEDYDSANDLFVVRGDGNCGIGTNAPDTLLHVKGDNARIVIEEAATEFMVIGQAPSDDGHNWIGFDDAKDLHIGMLHQVTDTSLDTIMTLGANRFVGIGTTSPAVLFELSQAAISGVTEFIRLSHATADQHYHTIDSIMHGSDAATNKMGFNVNTGVDNTTTRVLTLMGNGYCGVGQDTAGYPLDVKASPDENYAMRIWSDGGAANDYGLLIWAGPDANSPSLDDIRWVGLADGDGGLVSKLTSSGSGTGAGFVAPSDERMKDNIQDTSVNALGILNALKWRQFDWNTSKAEEFGWKTSGHEDMWLVAQEVEAVVSGVVGTDSETGCKELGDSWLIKYACKAIQELSAKVTVLENA